MTTRIHQELFQERSPYFDVEECSALQILSTFRYNEVLGYSISLSTSGAVEALAFSDADKVFYISLTGATTAAARRERDSSLTALLSGARPCLAGFSMGRLALHTYRRTRLHVCGTDLSTVISPSTKAPWSPVEFINKIVDLSITDRFRVLNLWYPVQESSKAIEQLCLRAWVTAICADSISNTVRSAFKTDTRNLSHDELVCIGRLYETIEILERAKPLRAGNEFKTINKSLDDGKLELQNARYNTRVRRSGTTRVIMETAEGRRIVGQAIHANGKTTKVQVMSGSFRGGVERVHVEGREESTCAETARDEFLLRLLQGEISLKGRSFIDLLWFPPAEYTTEQARPEHEVPSSVAFNELNDSQKAVAAAMISATEPLVIVHGPPGTGKTTTISAAVDYWQSQRAKPHVWIIAQSNVGVKNIARSLVGKKFFDFKLLVSKEFHYEWHEHLYSQIEENLIRSDVLFQEGGLCTADRMFAGCRIVLCTLSMLSNPALDKSGIFAVMPMEILVVDEASQINLAEFMHLFHKFNKLEKVCLFGDPKQLPPYGREVAPKLQCIFDVKHLKPRAYFLDTQYRMPVPLGEFISEQVYNQKLCSVHSISDLGCIRFIDACKGVEQRQGKSWINREEINIVTQLVEHYYRHTNFCIITPYDAQRAEIQKALEAQQLPHERVFNVDSFQGHEEEFVIISAVRTDHPGFLSVFSRNNVMLTRCTKGMVIVTNKNFVLEHADRTLLGKLASHWTELLPDDTWVDWRAVTSQVSDLPGVRAPKSHDSTPKASPVSAESTANTDSGRSEVFTGDTQALARQLSQVSLSEGCQPMQSEDYSPCSTMRMLMTCKERETQRVEGSAEERVTVDQPL